MGYYYAYCYCRECLNMDLNDRNKYDSNEAYCTERHKYFNPNSRACNNSFVYNENWNKSSSSGCYITTAVCDIMNLEDDNIYLEKLRNFRDNYMQKDPRLQEILVEYDIIGPMVSYNLKDDSFRRTISFMMLELYIKPITKLLDNQKYTEAILKYQEMTENLRTFYKIDKPDININEIDTHDIGKGHKIKIMD